VLKSQTSFVPLEYYQILNEGRHTICSTSEANYKTFIFGDLTNLRYAYRCDLLLTLPSDVYFTNMFDVYQCIANLNIFANETKVYESNGLQLWAFFHALDPTRQLEIWQPRQQQTRIVQVTVPLPMPPCGFPIANYMHIAVRVSMNRIRQTPALHKICRHILSYTKAASIFPLILSYVEDDCGFPEAHLVCYTQKLSLHDHYRLMDAYMIPYSNCSRSPMIYNQPLSASSQIGSFNLNDWSLRGKLAVLCAVVYDRFTQRYCPAGITSIHPLCWFAIDSKKTGCLKWDAEYCRSTDKINNGLNVPNDVLLYTITFQCPTYFTNEPSLLICPPGNLSIQTCLEWSQTDTVTVYWRWNDCEDKNGESRYQLHLWPLQHNLLLYLQGLIALRYSMSEG
jgi:hypothetical protein